MNELLTVQEVADFLRTTSTTIYRWLKNGKLQGVKIGKEWRISRVALCGFGFDFNEDKSLAEGLGGIVAKGAFTGDRLIAKTGF